MANMRKFENVAMREGHPNWEKAISRESQLYKRDDDIRSPFLRDYTRVLHSLAYRRLKHKTQVFYGAAGNDHICTRIEHVSHVDSVSNSIAMMLGLNEELTRAIAIAHDLGHAPFGHKGEQCLSKLTKEYLGEEFWHEKNGVHFVDDIELLEDPYSKKQNLDLTYAVRDGIISHCGEVDQNCIKPRDIEIDLSCVEKGGKMQAATWEGCVVKLADKIAYLGRDIEDAQRLQYFNKEQQEVLSELARKCNKDAVNTTVITHSMITDICANSDVEKGLCLSSHMEEVLNEIKRFNYENIYKSQRLDYYGDYSELIIDSIFKELVKYYGGKDTFMMLANEDYHYRGFIKDFAEYLANFCDMTGFEALPKDFVGKDYSNLNNKKIYGTLLDEKVYYRAIIDFIAGMTDNYATVAFQQLLMC